jgi:hypothetical protein
VNIRRAPVLHRHELGIHVAIDNAPVNSHSRLASFLGWGACELVKYHWAYIPDGTGS